MLSPFVSSLTASREWSADGTTEVPQGDASGTQGDALVVTHKF